MYTSNQEDSNDLYQEVIINLRYLYPEFRDESKLFARIYRVVLNTCISDLREKKILGYMPSNMELGVYDDCLRYESLKGAHRLIHQLDKHERMSVSLWLDENSYEGVAATTENNRNIVAVRLHRIEEKSKRMPNQQKTNMELDELKQKWMEPSEQMEEDKLLNRQIIINMIQSRKEVYSQ